VEEVKAQANILFYLIFIMLDFLGNFINFLFMSLKSTLYLKKFPFLKNLFSPIRFSIERESIERARFFITGPLVISGFDCTPGRKIGVLTIRS